MMKPLSLNLSVSPQDLAEATFVALSASAQAHYQAMMASLGDPKPPSAALHRQISTSSYNTVIGLLPANSPFIEPLKKLRDATADDIKDV
jgi:hypothetical protein